MLPEAHRAACAEELARMHAIGWKTHLVETQADIVAFARAFSRELYETTTALGGSS